jgi:MFS family permease
MSFTSRWSDVFLAAGARAVARCGDFLAAIALVLALQERGAGSGAVAAVMIAAAAPPVLLARWTGRLADRMDSRVILVVAGIAQAAVCFALAFASGTVAIVGLIAALGCGLAVTQPTLAALIPAMVTPEDLPKASAIDQTASSIGLLIAPALGGVLMGQFGLKVPLLIGAASYLAITVAGLLIRTRRGQVTAAAEPLATLRVRSDPLLWAMFVLLGAVVAAVAAVNVGEVYLIREELDGSATAFGLLSALWLGSMMIGSWLTARRALSDGGLGVALLVMMAATCAVCALCAVAPTIAWLVPLFLIGGATNGGENVAANVLLARRIRPEQRGRAFAAYGAVGSAASVVGFLLGGVLLNLISVRVLFAGAGGLALLVCGLCAIPLLRAVRREAQEPLPRLATQATA